MSIIPVFFFLKATIKVPGSGMHKHLKKETDQKWTITTKKRIKLNIHLSFLDTTNALVMPGEQERNTMYFLCFFIVSIYKSVLVIVVVVFIQVHSPRTNVCIQTHKNNNNMIMVINKQEKRTYIFYERQVSCCLFCNNKNIGFRTKETQQKVRSGMKGRSKLFFVWYGSLCLFDIMNLIKAGFEYWTDKNLDQYIGLIKLQWDDLVLSQKIEKSSFYIGKPRKVNTLPENAIKSWN